MILRDASNSIIGLILEKFKVGVILSSKLVIFKAEYHFKYQHGINHDKTCQNTCSVPLNIVANIKIITIL